MKKRNMGSCSGFIDVGYGSMHYQYFRCPGVPVLFLHGTGCDNADWRPVLDAAAPSLPRICLEFRGHGRSDVCHKPFTIADLAADVVTVLDKLDISAAVLCGHSLGGMVAVAVAALTPAVKGLVLLEGWTSLRAVADAYRQEHMYGNLPQAVIERIQQKSREYRGRFEPAVWNHFWESVRAFDGSAILAASSLPIAELYGTVGLRARDPGLLQVPEKGNIQLVWLENSGHYPNFEVPGAVAAVIADFCAGGI